MVRIHRVEKSAQHSKKAGAKVMHSSKDLISLEVRENINKVETLHTGFIFFTSTIKPGILDEWRGKEEKDRLW